VKYEDKVRMPRMDSSLADFALNTIKGRHMLSQFWIWGGGARGDGEKVLQSLWGVANEGIIIYSQDGSAFSVKQLHVSARRRRCLD
jgi:hypothetical protein